MPELKGCVMRISKWYFFRFSTIASGLDLSSPNAQSTQSQIYADVTSKTQY